MAQARGGMPPRLPSLDQGAELSPSHSRVSPVRCEVGAVRTAQLKPVLGEHPSEVSTGSGSHAHGQRNLRANQASVLLFSAILGPLSSSRLGGAATTSASTPGHALAVFRGNKAFLS
jgi:hypothetical protein